MRVKLDENLSDDIRVFFENAQCDVETVLNEKLGGQADPVIVDAARHEQRVLVTLDKGIANPQSPEIVGHAGIVLIRLKHPSVAAILMLLETHIENLKSQSLNGRIVVLSSNGIRIR